MSSVTQIAKVSFLTESASDAITRPANTTQYTAGDVVADATDNAFFTFTFAQRQGKVSGSFSTARIVSSANQSTKPTFELWLFRATPGTTADNATWDVSDAELLDCIGVISFAQADWKGGTLTAGAGGNAYCQATNIGIAFNAVDTSIYGILVERATYTPVSGETFTIELTITRD